MEILKAAKAISNQINKIKQTETDIKKINKTSIIST